MHQVLSKYKQQKIPVGKLKLNVMQFTSYEILKISILSGHGFSHMLINSGSSLGKFNKAVLQNMLLLIVMKNNWLESPSPTLIEKLPILYPYSPRSPQF